MSLSTWIRDYVYIPLGGNRVRRGVNLLLASFSERPPAYFIRVRPFFPGVKIDPLDQWAALKKIIERDYVLREKFGRIHLLERLDRIPEAERAELKKKAQLDGARPAKVDIRPVDRRGGGKPAATPKPAPKPPPTPAPKPPPPPDDDDESDDNRAP